MFDVTYTDARVDKIYFTIMPMITFTTQIRVKFYGKMVKSRPMESLHAFVMRTTDSGSQFISLNYDELLKFPKKYDRNTREAKDLLY